MSIYCTGCQCCVHMWPLPAVVKEMERPCRLCLGNPFRSQVSACSFQGYRPGKIIKWPTNPHKCSQFQFGEIMIQIFTSQQKKTNNCWMLGTFANLFFGGDGNPYWTGRHLYEVVFFFHGELSKVRKRQQSWFCGHHVWKPSEMGPGFFIFAGFGVGRHATVLRTQHCLPGVLLWEPDIRKKVFQQAHRDIHKSRSCETWRTNLQMSQHLPTSFSKLGFERQHVWRELFFFGPLWND